MTTDEMPSRIRRLPYDKNGVPVPWFVAFVDGEPDFRVVEPIRVTLAVKLGLCWTCGHQLGVHKAYVIGPMCVVNRVSAEPPSHHDCAVYAATHCPFLVNPKKRRRVGGLPEETHMPGVAILRNPGVSAVYNSRNGKPFRAPGGGVLFDVGTPESVEWYAEGRRATRAEVEASVASGLPVLRDMATEEGPDALTELDQHLRRAESLYPA